MSGHQILLSELTSELKMKFINSTNYTSDFFTTYKVLSDSISEFGILIKSYQFQIQIYLLNKSSYQNLQEEQMTITGDRRFQNPHESENNKQVRPIS